MIRPLRATHRLVWTVLALLLPALLAVALARRHPLPNPGPETALPPVLVPGAR